MAVTKALLYSVLLVLVLNWWSPSECKTVTKQAPSGDNELKIRGKRFVDPLSVIGLVVSVASAIQGAVCTFSEVCGGDETTKKLEALEEKLDSIQSDVTSIKKDVEDIWDESKRKWYFNHIEYIINQRKRVINDIKNEDNTARAKGTRDRFINEVFGVAGKDEYVEKALFHIPGLVTQEGLVTHKFKTLVDDGKSTEEAAKLTWQFTRKLFRYQEDGYASVVLAASLKYKEDEASYNKTMSQICAWWPKDRDPEYQKFCAKFIKDLNSQDRRKVQNDYLFGIRDLGLFPVHQVKTDCQKFKDSNGLYYAAGHLFVSQPGPGNILIVDPQSLNILKTITLPGSQCGGKCHPFDISIHVEKKLMAVAAHNQAQGGTSYVLMYKIKGDLSNPSGITLEHHYTLAQLFKLTHTKNYKTPDVRGVAFCGNRFAYADYAGAIFNYGMTMNYRQDPDTKKYVLEPEPNLWDRLDWYIDRMPRGDHLRGNIYYFGCSVDGASWVIEKSSKYGSSSNSIGSVPGNSRGRSLNNVLEDVGDIVETTSSWSHVQDGRSRLNIIRGGAMDNKRNLFYSACQYWANGVSGIYQRTYDGKHHYLREWDHREPANKVDFFDMAVTDNGYMFLLQKDGNNGKCLHKFDHEMDLEDSFA